MPSACQCSLLSPQANPYMELSPSTSCIGDVCYCFSKLKQNPGLSKQSNIQHLARINIWKMCSLFRSFSASVSWLLDILLFPRLLWVGICLWSLSQLTWWWSTEICKLILRLAVLLEVLNISINLLMGFWSHLCTILDHLSMRITCLLFLLYPFNFLLLSPCPS